MIEIMIQRVEISIQNHSNIEVLNWSLIIWMLNHAGSTFYISALLFLTSKIILQESPNLTDVFHGLHMNLFFRAYFLSFCLSFLGNLPSIKTNVSCFFLAEIFKGDAAEGRRKSWRGEGVCIEVVWFTRKKNCKSWFLQIDWFIYKMKWPILCDLWVFLGIWSVNL